MESIYNYLERKITKEEEDLKRKNLKRKKEIVLWYDRLKNWKPKGWCECCTPVDYITFRDPRDGWNSPQVVITLKQGSNTVKCANIIFDEFLSEFGIDPEDKLLDIRSYAWSINLVNEYFRIEVNLVRACRPIMKTFVYEEVIGYTC